MIQKFQKDEWLLKVLVYRDFKPKLQTVFDMIEA
jgi:hypothetical protein